MKVITKRDRIKGVLNSWKEQYPTGKELVIEKLSCLDFNKVSEDEINKIIGNSSWTSLTCDACGKESEVLVKFLEENDEEYESNSCSLCGFCLGDALAIIKSRNVKLKLSVDKGGKE